MHNLRYDDDCINNYKNNELCRLKNFLNYANKNNSCYYYFFNIIVEKQIKLQKIAIENLSK